MHLRNSLFSGLLALGIMPLAGVAQAQSLYTAPPLPKPSGTHAQPTNSVAPQINNAEDPRAGDVEFQRMQKLFGAIRNVLEEAASAREAARSETSATAAITGAFGLDAKSRSAAVLTEAFEVVSNAPVTEIQGTIEHYKENQRRLRNRLARLREDRISAPEDAGLAGRIGLAHSREDIEREIEETQARIAGNEMAVRVERDRFRDAMAATGAPLSEEEAMLLLDSVTGNDIVKLSTAFATAKDVSNQFLKLLDESDEDLALAKRYYAMHTALIALLVQAQTDFVEKIDEEFIPKLNAIDADIRAARAETQRLLANETDPRRQQNLQSNLAAQAIAIEAGNFYREHLKTQRIQVLNTRMNTVRELEVADNTLRTVDASFQLRSLIENATINFDALQRMQSPVIERFFRNEQLQREFRELSAKLAGT